jgi:hypothetical protein
VNRFEAIIIEGGPFVLLAQLKSAERSNTWTIVTSGETTPLLKVPDGKVTDSNSKQYIHSSCELTEDLSVSRLLRTMSSRT